MRVLITGSVGFIGFHLSKRLLSLGHEVHGIDNFNTYYDINLKINRDKILNKLGLTTQKIDISNKNQLDEYFQNKNFDVIFHLAAQAGVRYSLENPDIYISSNIIGSFNLLENIKKINLKHLLIASTSSVYGLNDNESFNERYHSNEPISLYSSTKKSVENISYNYSYNFRIPITNFRFFTVYGPWGRPDMALFKFTNALFKNESVDVYNNGEMWRDFTYIDDLVQAVELLSHKVPNSSDKYENDSLSKDAPYRIVNIGNQKTVKLNDFIETLEYIANRKLIRNNLPMQPGDVPYTLADSTLLKNLTNFYPKTTIAEGIKKFYEWFIDYYHNNY